MRSTEGKGDRETVGFLEGSGEPWFPRNLIKYCNDSIDVQHEFNYKNDLRYCIYLARQWTN
jgi:hypothetical protein